MKKTLVTAIAVCFCWHASAQKPQMKELRNTGQENGHVVCFYKDTGVVAKMLYIKPNKNGKYPIYEYRGDLFDCYPHDNWRKERDR